MATKQECLDYATAATNDDDIEVLLVMKIRRDGTSASFMSAYPSAMALVYALGGAIRYVINTQQQQALDALETHGEFAVVKPRTHVQ